ncbi:hypothetical protein MMC15_001381 [Xylographa vitiligo]|nr:hypothetical protein [Xylographa vitiligo]
MLKLLIALLSFTAISVATAARTPSEHADPRPTAQSSRQSVGRRVYLEVDLQLAHALIRGYRGEPNAPAVLSIYIESDTTNNPALKANIRVIDYHYGVVLPTPYVEETSFPYLFPGEQQAGFVTHGPGIEIYPLGVTTLQNHAIMDSWTGEGIIRDLLKESPAINDVHDANNNILYLANSLGLRREGFHPDVNRVMDYVTGSREWYRQQDIRFYCEMPLVTYQGHNFKRTFNVEKPGAPIILFNDEVKDFIQSIAHKVKPPPSMEPF